MWLPGLLQGRADREFQGPVMPVFDTVQEAVDKEGANVAAIYVPPPFAADSILRSHRCGDPPESLQSPRGFLCETWPRSKPVWQLLQLPSNRPQLPRASLPLSECRDRRSCPAIFTNQAKWASFPVPAPSLMKQSGKILAPAGHESVHLYCGIGWCDPINGTSHLEAVKLFNEDPETEAIILIGEIGGTAAEEEAAALY